MKELTISGHFGFVFEKNSVMKITLSSCHRFRNWLAGFRSVPKCSEVFRSVFHPHVNEKLRLSDSSWFEERFLSSAFMTD